MLLVLAYIFMYLTNVRAYCRPILVSTIERCPLLQTCKEGEGGLGPFSQKGDFFHKKCSF